jgi:tetratricopeptide (TPR) repeat protein
MDYLRRGDYSKAHGCFLAATRETPGDWYVWYGMGQSARFLERHEEACHCLARAARLKPGDPPILLALGIAQQLSGEFDEAIAALAAAIDADADYALAYNSLALTQKKKGELDKALHNYDAGTKALARTFVKTMVNSPHNRILKFEEVPGELWTGCAVFAALYHAAVIGKVERVAWMTGEQAMEEERINAHQGLLFVDERAASETIRLFLPNFSNTFREFLKADTLYANLIGNQGTVLELLNRPSDSRRYFREAEWFAAGRELTTITFVYA